jgi:hypothetical protein
MILSLGKYFPTFRREIKALRSFETSETIYLTTQHNILEDLNLQQQHCEYFKLGWVEEACNISTITETIILIEEAGDV